MPVKERSLEMEVECDSPESANAPEYLEKLKTLDADLFVVADYGEILREPFLETPRIGAFNLHASILPKFRGAAPVARAILGGETRSGVTLFRIERKLDSGPIVAVSEVGIESGETSGELENRLATISARSDMIEGTMRDTKSGPAADRRSAPRRSAARRSAR